MGWWVNIADVKFKITPEIKDEDKSKIVNFIENNNTICEVKVPYTEYSNYPIDELLDKIKPDEYLNGWILVDWETIKFSFDEVKYGNIEEEQIIKLVNFLKELNYNVNGDLHYVSEEEYGFLLKIINSKIYTLEIDIDYNNMNNYILNIISNNIKENEIKFNELN